MRKKFLVFCCAAALAVSAAGCSPAEKAPAQETQTEQQTEAPETEESSQEAEGSAQEMAVSYRITCNNGNQRPLINP